MSESTSLRTHSILIEGRAASQWLLGLLGSVALLAVTAAYCELCSIVNDKPAPGWQVSVPWAFKVSLGWAAVGVAFAVLGPRVAASSFASRRPLVTAGLVVIGVSLFTLLSEAGLMQLLGRADDVRDQRTLIELAYARSPLALLASALMLAIYVIRTKAIQRAAPAAPIASVPSQSPQVLEVMTGTGRTSICIDDIEYLRADRNYITVMHTSGRTYLLRQTMNATESSLDPRRFMRIHRSIIVNRDRVKEHRPGGVLVLSCGHVVRCSRSLRKQLRSNGRHDGTDDSNHSRAS